jgi:hypothetical protein
MAFATSLNPSVVPVLLMTNRRKSKYATKHSAAMIATATNANPKYIAALTRVLALSRPETRGRGGQLVARRS